MTIIKTPLSMKLALLLEKATDCFECSLCKRIFECATLQEEIERQFKKNFGPEAADGETELLCDECFKMVIG